MPAWFAVVGSVGEVAAAWFTAIGTVGTLAAAIGLHIVDVRDRKRAQARSVSVWAEWERREEESDKPRQFYAYCRNTGEAAIYVTDGLAYFEPNSESSERVKFGIVPPRETRRWGLDLAKFPPDRESAPSVWIKFIADEKSWRRDSEGHLDPI